MISKEEVGAMVDGIKSSLNNPEVAELKDKLDKIEEAAQKQGTSLAIIQKKIEFGGQEYKSIAQVFKENEEEMKKVFKNGSGSVDFMVVKNHLGQWTMKPFDKTSKAAGPVATVENIGGTFAPSISQNIDSATLLRVGGNAQIQSQYRNTAWLFDLINTVTAGWNQSFAMWYDEQAKDGTGAATNEGGTKPKVQYIYKLQSSSYKKVAALIGFTDEFNLDFQRLQDDIMNKGQRDVMNVLNASILTNITTAATAYNTSSSFGGATVPNVNDWDVIAALAAQADNATFGNNANASLMSTFKKYRMGITKNANGTYVDRPSVLDNIAFVANPAMGADAVIVGDLKQYNAILRGGLIVKVGFNGNDFANNMFSVVIEQYYFDYISDVRKPAIVKGPDFGTVKTAIGLPAQG
jgi:gas vesicle protein